MTNYDKVRNVGKRQCLLVIALKAPDALLNNLNQQLL